MSSQCSFTETVNAIYRVERLKLAHILIDELPRNSWPEHVAELKALLTADNFRRVAPGRLNMC